MKVEDDGTLWFTAGEAAEIAAKARVAGIPWTREGMTKRMKRVAAETPRAHATWSRRRPGRKGGGGIEHHWMLFPDVLRDHLRFAIHARLEALQAEAHSRWRSDHRAWDAMRALFPDTDIPSFTAPITRVVWRSRVHVRNKSYWDSSLEKYVGQRVLVVFPQVRRVARWEVEFYGLELSENRLADCAFIWSVDCGFGPFENRGAEGIIGVAEMDPIPRY